MTDRMQFTGGPFGTAGQDFADLVPAGISGQVFYVNANAGSTDDAASPWPAVDEERCFSTLQGAIDKCVDNRGDTIYVKKGGEAVTTAVNFNCPMIRVITQRFGMNPRARGEYTSIYSTTIVDGPCAIISSPCYIEGIAFAGADATTGFYAGGALRIGDSVNNLYGAHLYQCRFPKWGLDNSHGITIDGTAAVSNVLLDDIDFEGAFDSGVYIQGAIGHFQMKNCTGALATYLLEAGAFSDAGVNTQLMIGPGNVTCTPTRAINSGSNAAKAQVFENSWGAPVATAYDITVDNMETAGWLCAGNNYSDEEGDDE